MYRNNFKQLLVAAAIIVGALAGLGFAEAGPIEQREIARFVSFRAADDALTELDREKAVLAAALISSDASKWAATPPNFLELLNQIGKGLALPALPEATLPTQDLPSDGAEARKMISSVVEDISNRNALTIMLAAEPDFGSSVNRKLKSLENNLSELSASFAQLGRKLGSPYAAALGYSDVDGAVYSFKSVVADLLGRTQVHEALSMAADSKLRENSRPLLLTASVLLREEGARLNDEKLVLDDLAAALAKEAKLVQADYEEIDAAFEKNNTAVGSLLQKERDLEVAAAKRAVSTGLAADKEAANTAKQELNSFRHALAVELSKLGDEKSAILSLRTNNAGARDRLQKTAAVALARYKTFESQQAGNNADHATLAHIKF